MIREKLKKIKSGKLTAEQNIKNFINKIKKENNKINAVLHLNEKAISEARAVDKKSKRGKLAGIGFIVKSNINVKGLICNCASKTLKNYISTYNASVIDKLLKEDAIVIGMANMDEFGCGASGETSAFGICKNPKALDRIPGGSSSGSAACVAAGFCDFALGSDTGGSIRNPASHCGVVGMKPSYGAVSRYGLIDLSMSLDQIGPLGDCVEDCEIVYNILKGKDENDSVGLDYNNGKKDLKKIKIGMIMFGKGQKTIGDRGIWQLIGKKVQEVLEREKWSLKIIQLKHIDLGIQTYYPINYVEFFSGTRKFDGRMYGFKIEDVCGEEVLRRILGGSEISKAEFAGKYYRRALKAKKIIENEFAKAFNKVDVIVMPTVPKLPHKIGQKVSIEDLYDYDALTVLANLAEIPAISVPCGRIKGSPVGLQVLGKKGDDLGLLSVGKRFE